MTDVEDFSKEALEGEKDLIKTIIKITRNVESYMKKLFFAD